MSACSLIWIWLIDGMTYSTGSSMVMMLRSESLISLSAAYSVVVFPLPVGPAQITMPYGDPMSSENSVRVSRGMPSRSSWSNDRLLSRRRSTAFSPQIVAIVATRTSSGRPSTIASNWPSWARRRSTMFISARILIRLTSDCAVDRRATARRRGARRRPGTGSAPSSACGSMWRSEARSRTAWVRRRWKIWTIGAFSSTTSAPAASPSVAAAAMPGWKVATTRSRPLNASYDRSMARSTSLAGASTKRTVLPGGVAQLLDRGLRHRSGDRDHEEVVVGEVDRQRAVGADQRFGERGRPLADRATPAGGRRAPRSSCSESALTSSPSLMIPCSTRISPRRRPELVCSSNACWIISLVSAPRDSSISPRAGPLCTTRRWRGGFRRARLASRCPRLRRGRPSDRGDVFGGAHVIAATSSGATPWADPSARHRPRPDSADVAASAGGARRRVLRGCIPVFFERNFMCRIGPNWRRRRARNGQSVPRSSLRPETDRVAARTLPRPTTFSGSGW